MGQGPPLACRLCDRALVFGGPGPRSQDHDACTQQVCCAGHQGHASCALRAAFGRLKKVCRQEEGNTVCLANSPHHGQRVQCCGIFSTSQAPTGIAGPAARRRNQTSNLPAQSSSSPASRSAPAHSFLRCTRSWLTAQWLTAPVWQRRRRHTAPQLRLTSAQRHLGGVLCQQSPPSAAAQRRAGSLLRRR